MRDRTHGTPKADGEWPGGEGIERDLEMLEDVTVSLITERRVSRPWGVAGGGPGSVGENWLVPQGDEGRAKQLPDKCTIRMQAGDVLRMLTPGGGGWGPHPRPRDLRQMSPGQRTLEAPPGHGTSRGTIEIG
jgi:N-methylhydantoinase B/oxoprolinase/acetone carboxylase alpha subunit